MSLIGRAARVIVSCVILGTAAAPLIAQSVAGRVIAAGSGQPIPGAAIVLLPPDGTRVASAIAGTG